VEVVLGKTYIGVAAPNDYGCRQTDRADGGARSDRALETECSRRHDP
jgi:hypothetical protein